MLIQQALIAPEPLVPLLSSRQAVQRLPLRLDLGPRVELCSELIARAQLRKRRRQQCPGLSRRLHRKSQEEKDLSQRENAKAAKTRKGKEKGITTETRRHGETRRDFGGERAPEPRAVRLSMLSSGSLPSDPSVSPCLRG